MQFNNTNDRYGRLSIGLHWLMFLLIVAVYACIELREFYPKGSELRDGLKHWHFKCVFSGVGAHNRQAVAA
jgi:superoxide oxidase